MVLISDSRGRRESSGYTRIFGDPLLGHLLHRVQAPQRRAQRHARVHLSHRAAGHVEAPGGFILLVLAGKFKFRGITACAKSAAETGLRGLLGSL